MFTEFICISYTKNSYRKYKFNNYSNFLMLLKQKNFFKCHKKILFTICLLIIHMSIYSVPKNYFPLSLYTGNPSLDEKFLLKKQKSDGSSY